MLYDRKIKYLDYYEGGVKVNGGGFAKLEVRNNTLRIELTVRGLHPTDSFERDIVLQGAEKEETLGQIRIQNGCGQFRYSCDADQEIGATGISYSELRGIRISIGGTREILCRWDNDSDKRRIAPPEENSKKSNPSLQESKRESIVESNTGNGVASEVSVYTEDERLPESRLGKTGKTEEKRKDAKQEANEGTEGKDREEKDREEKDGEINREYRDREGQEEKNRQNRDREGQEEKNREDRDREGQEEKSRQDKDRDGQEEENRGDKDRERQEEKSREYRDRERQGEKSKEDRDRERQEEKSREDRDRERQGEKSREDRDRERQEEKSREGRDRGRQEGKNRVAEDRERQEDKNKEDKEAAKQESEKKESKARDKGDNEGSETKGEDMKPDAQSGSTEIQAQETTMSSDVLSAHSQLPQEPLQAVLHSEEQSEAQVKDKLAIDVNNRAEQPNRAEQSDMRKAPVKLMEDKWQQLSAIYPHIQPFRDERDYLSLTPSDFVLFPNRFYRAVNNSFLLHGYYNYHHLILARIERRGEFLYYIGVPGNYFEREKQVAIMFGFESFECETEPAKTGDFGYYMMRTEL